MKSVPQSHDCPSPSHPLIAHYCLSSSVPLLASFACLTSLDTKVSRFIRFSHSLGPEPSFQSPRMGKYHHLPSQLPVPGCHTLPKKVTKPGWPFPLQFRASWSHLGPHCCLTILVLIHDLQSFVFPMVSIPRFILTLSFLYDLPIPRKSQGQYLISSRSLFFSPSKPQFISSDLIGKCSPLPC